MTTMNLTAHGHPPLSAKSCDITSFLGLHVTLPLNSTAHIMVSVADDNFNLDDIVTLSAMSSSRTIVLVVPTRVAGITTDTSTTFVLSAEQDEEATITFTATDNRGLKSNSETMSVDVITAIRISVKVFLEGPFNKTYVCLLVR